MDYLDSAASAFPVTLGELATMSVAQAFALAGVVLVGFVLLMGLAALANRWFSNGIDSIFEWLLLLALGAAAAWLYMQGFDPFW